MKCPNCGRDLADDARFGDDCGCRIPESTTETESELTVKEEKTIPEEQIAIAETPTEEPVPAETTDAKPDKKLRIPEKILKYKKYIAIAAAALVLIILISIAVSAIDNKPDELSDAKYYIAANTEDDTSRIYLNGKNIGGKQPFKSVTTRNYSQDGNTMVLLVADDVGDTFLYSVTGKKIAKCDNDVNRLLRLTLDGKEAYYVKKNDDGQEELWKLTVKSGKTTKIATADLISGFGLSYNGKYCVFTTVASDEIKIEKNVKLFKYDGKSVNELCKIQSISLGISGISANGKKVYVLSQETDGSKLYVVNRKGEKTKIVSGVSNVYFNKDATQALIVADKGTYYSKNGGEAVKLTSGTARYCDSLGSSRNWLNYQFTDNLLDEYWTVIGSSKSTLMKFSKNPDKNITVLSNSSNYAYVKILNDKKTLVVLKGDNLKITSLKYGEDAIDKAKDVVNNVAGCIVTDDGKRVYYRNDDNELYTCKLVKDAQPTRVSSEYLGYMYQVNDKFVMFASESDVFYGVNGTRKKLIGEDLKLKHVCENGLYFTDEDDALYYVSSATKAKKVK